MHKNGAFEACKEHSECNLWKDMSFLKTVYIFCTQALAVEKILCTANMCIQKSFCLETA